VWHFTWWPFLWKQFDLFTALIYNYHAVEKGKNKASSKGYGK
jgi:hypothetical protein